MAPSTRPPSKDNNQRRTPRNWKTHTQTSKNSLAHRRRPQLMLLLAAAASDAPTLAKNCRSRKGEGQVDLMAGDVEPNGPSRSNRRPAARPTTRSGRHLDETIQPRGPANTTTISLGKRSPPPGPRRRRHRQRQPRPQRQDHLHRPRNQPEQHLRKEQPLPHPEPLGQTCQLLERDEVQRRRWTLTLDPKKVAKYKGKISDDDVDDRRSGRYGRRTTPNSASKPCKSS